MFIILGHKTKHKIEEDKLSNASAEEMSIGSDSPGISRKISDDGSSNESPVHVRDRSVSRDSDSLSLKSDASDKNTGDISSHNSPTSHQITGKAHSSPSSHLTTGISHSSHTSHHHKTGKGRKKSKDVFSRIEQNLDSLEGLEKHLTTNPQKYESSVSESYLKNFEHRAGFHDTSVGSETPDDDVKQAPAELPDDEQELASDSYRSDISTKECELPNKTSDKSSIKENVSSKSDNKKESDLNKPAVRTERSISIEDSIYSKYSSKDESETAGIVTERDTLLHKLPESDRSAVHSPESSTSSHKRYYQTPDSSLDDFYRKFGSAHSNLSSMDEDISPGSVKQTSMGKKKEESQLHKDTVESQSGNSELTTKNKEVEETQSLSLNESEIAPSYKLVNNWTEIQTIGNLTSLCLTNSHVWITDKGQNIYYSCLSGTGIKWQKVNGYAKQMAVSKSGFIVWRLYKDTVYVGTRVTSKRPEGLKWEEAVREVQFIAVTESCAWYVIPCFNFFLTKYYCYNVFSFHMLK